MLSIKCHSKIYRFVDCFFCFVLNGIGELNAIRHLVIEGYDHIVDVHDDTSITNVAYSRGYQELGKYLSSIPTFEVKLISLCFHI